MKQSLLLGLVIWVGTVAAYYFGLRHLMAFPGNLICAVLGGTFLLMLVGAIRGLIRGRGDARLIREANEAKPLVDKRRVAVAGCVYATGPALRSPASGLECVLYEYEVAHEETYTTTDSDNRDETRERRVVDMSGMGMTACVIEGPRGKVGLAGFPVMEPYKGTVYSDSGAFGHLDKHLRAHPPKERTGAAKLGSLGEFASAFGHDGNPFQMDWRLTKKPLRSSGQTITEKRIMPGDPVVAFGIYDAEKRALVGRDGWGASYNQLYPGGPEDAARQISKKGATTLVVAFLFFAIFHGVFGFMVNRSMHYVPGSAEQESKIRHFVDARDASGLKDYVQHHTSHEVSARVLTSLLCDARNVETAKMLLDAGADLNAPDPSNGSQPLMTAARYGILPTVNLLLERGADPRIVEKQTHHPLILVAHKCGRQEIVDRLIKEGVREVLVTPESGKPLPADGGEPFGACVAYLQAVQKSDPATLSKLTSRAAPISYNDVNFDIWKKYRPAQPKFVSGYVNTLTSELGGTQAATLTATDPAFPNMAWNYHLLREDGQWRIYAEWSSP